MAVGCALDLLAALHRLGDIVHAVAQLAGNAQLVELALVAAQHLFQVLTFLRLDDYHRVQSYEILGREGQGGRWHGSCIFVVLSGGDRF